ncbi:hypothetical protein IQ07DRAFT_640768 [Pyrenochaeta sp. DS3sAY3a]|nr:hypothetical protein IQ07DRAFT_640768 [Pyrenochaeta sp. DS3sAY3a]
MSEGQASPNTQRLMSDQATLKQQAKSAKVQPLFIPSDVYALLVKRNKTPTEKAGLENSIWRNLNSQMALDQFDGRMGPWHGRTHFDVIPIRNPEAFPLWRLRQVQHKICPNTAIRDMLAIRDAANGLVIRVTADLVNGPVDHLVIEDMRLICAMGLQSGDHDTIKIHVRALRAHEAFHILPLKFEDDGNTDPSDAWLAGLVVPARHPYLFWLDIRGSADPVQPPYTEELNLLALRLGRIAEDVRYEVQCMYHLENRLTAQHREVYRGHRLYWLGEDPKYDALGRRVRS